MQHWFVLLRYHSRAAYTLIELSLEVAFQIEVLSYVAYFTTPWGLAFDRLGRGCALTMLLSHWLWFGSACLRKLQPLIDALYGTAVGQALESGLEGVEGLVNLGIDTVEMGVQQSQTTSSKVLEVVKQPARMLKRASTLSAWRASVQQAESRRTDHVPDKARQSKAAGKRK